MANVTNYALEALKFCRSSVITSVTQALNLSIGELIATALYGENKIELVSVLQAAEDGNLELVKEEGEVLKVSFHV